MIRHLLDTSICIELIRGRNRVIYDRLSRSRSGSVGISIITMAELEYGVAKSREPVRNALALGRFCAPLRLIDYGLDAAVTYGPMRASLERAGTPIGPLDTLIAAQALAIRAVLVTASEREFQRVSGLMVENWLSP